MNLIKYFIYFQLFLMDSSRPNSQHQQVLLKSPLSPDQIAVLGLFNACGIRLDNRTFLNVWRLVNLGVPPNVIVDILRDVAAK